MKSCRTAGICPVPQESRWPIELDERICVGVTGILYFQTSGVPHPLGEGFETVRSRNGISVLLSYGWWTESGRDLSVSFGDEVVFRLEKFWRAGCRCLS